MLTAAAAPTTAKDARSASGWMPRRRPIRPISSRTRNPGGHSSRPRPDNAIYDLADALKKVQAHRFTPVMNDVNRAYFTARAQDEKGPLGDAMRRWLADPNDGAAADAIEADPLEVGKTRTRCVATMLEGGHADNALPQSARATVNCRIMPGRGAEGHRGGAQGGGRSEGRDRPGPRLHRQADTRPAASCPTCSCGL